MRFIIKKKKTKVKNSNINFFFLEKGRNIYSMIKVYRCAQTNRQA